MSSERGRTLARTRALLLLACVCACTPAATPKAGGAETKAAPLNEAPPAAGAEAAPAPSTSAMLVIAPLRLHNASGEELVLSAAGQLEVPSRKHAVGTLQPDGRLVNGSGEALAWLTADGDVFIAGKKLPMRLDPSGKLLLEGGSQVLSFNAAGELEGGRPEAPAVKVEGLTDDTRRTAMFLLVLAAFPRRE